MRKIIAILEVDDEKAIVEDLGTIEYVERELGWIQDSGIYLEAARILDDDDSDDAEALDLAGRIFNNEI